VREKALDERHLDLDGVFLGKRFRQKAGPRSLGDGPGQVCIDAGDAERRREPAFRLDGRALERDPVGRPDDDHRADLPAPDESVRGRGRPPGIDVARVGDDEADRPSGGGRCRGRRGQEAIRANKGASRRTLDMVCELLNSTGGGTGNNGPEAGTPNAG